MNSVTAQKGILTHIQHSEYLIFGKCTAELKNYYQYKHSYLSSFSQSGTCMKH